MADCNDTNQLTRRGEAADSALRVTGSCPPQYQSIERLIDIVRKTGFDLIELHVSTITDRKWTFTIQVVARSAMANSRLEKMVCELQGHHSILLEDGVAAGRAVSWSRKTGR